jgi:hypothetical protein
MNIGVFSLGMAIFSRCGALLGGYLDGRTNSYGLIFLLRFVFLEEKEMIGRVMCMYACHSVLSSPPILSCLLSLANYGCGVKVCYQHCDVWGFGLCRCCLFCSCFTERFFCGGGEAGVEMDTEYMWLSVYIMRLA